MISFKQHINEKVEKIRVRGTTIIINTGISNSDVKSLVNDAREKLEKKYPDIDMSHTERTLVRGYVLKGAKVIFWNSMQNAIHSELISQYPDETFDRSAAFYIGYIENTMTISAYRSNSSRIKSLKPKYNFPVKSYDF